MCFRQLIHYYNRERVEKKRETILAKYEQLFETLLKHTGTQFLICNS